LPLGSTPWYMVPYGTKNTTSEVIMPCTTLKRNSLRLKSVLFWPGMYRVGYLTDNSSLTSFFFYLIFIKKQEYTNTFQRFYKVPEMQNFHACSKLKNILFLSCIVKIGDWLLFYRYLSIVSIEMYRFFKANKFKIWMR
jgi:hypothetical protein